MEYFSKDKVLRYLDRVDSQYRSAYSSPAHVVFHSCDACNLSCGHCPYKHTNEMLSREALLSLCVAVSNNSNIKACSFSGGGEPLLQPGISDALGILGYKRTGIITNGVLLHTMGPSASRLAWLNVSLDALTKESFSEKKGADYFDQVVDNVFSFRGLYPNVSLRVSFVDDGKTNYDHSLVRKFLRCGIKVRVKGTPGVTVPDVVEHKTYIQEAPDISKYCYMRYLNPVINAQGKLMCSCTFSQDKTGMYEMTASTEETIQALKKGVLNTGNRCLNFMRNKPCYADRQNNLVYKTLSEETDWMFL